jgi:hypothetical protein
MSEESRLSFQEWIKQVYPHENYESMSTVSAVIPRILKQKLSMAYGYTKFEGEYDFSEEEWLGMWIVLGNLLAKKED